MSDSYSPVAGTPLSLEDIELVVESVTGRRERFPEEPLEISISLVLANIGDRFAPVYCTGEEEWGGLKSDIPYSEGIPLCPNGHTLYQEGGLKLGWLSIDELDD